MAIEPDHAEPSFALLIGWGPEKASLLADLLAMGVMVTVAPSTEVARRWRMPALGTREPDGDRSPVAVGDLRVDPAANRAIWKGIEIVLTKQDLLLLSVLARNLGAALSFEFLASEVWGGTHHDDGRLKSAIGRLRRKLRGAGLPFTIQSERGFGFRLAHLGFRSGEGGRAVTRPVSVIGRP